MYLLFIEQSLIMYQHVSLLNTFLLTQFECEFHEVKSWFCYHCIPKASGVFGTMVIYWINASDIVININMIDLVCLTQCVACWYPFWKPFLRLNICDKPSNGNVLRTFQLVRFLVFNSRRHFKKACRFYRIYCMSWP